MFVGTVAIALAFLGSVHADGDLAQTKQVVETGSEKPSAGAPEKKNLEGTWVFTKTSGGPGPKKDGGAGLRVVFKENTIAFVPEGNKPSLRGAYTIDASKNPKTMDFTLENKGTKLVTQAIFELEGDNLKLCHYLGPKASKARPTAFAADEQTVVGILKRVKD